MPVKGPSYSLAPEVEMIAVVNGKVIFVEEESLVVDVGGVGYEVFCTNNSLDQVLLGDQVLLHTYTHVREDQLQLFGFIDKFEKQLFLSLIKVNGIGPKMAMQSLSGARPEQIVRMIEDGDVKALMKLPKLGKKKAEQLVLTLKGKLVLADDDVVSSDPVGKEVKSALMNLGYAEEQVNHVMKELGNIADVESGVRKSLGLLSAGL